MYDEMTNSGLIVVAYEEAHPSDNPSSENADLIDELCSRLRKMEGYRMDDDFRDAVEVLLKDAKLVEMKPLFVEKAKRWLASRESNTNSREDGIN